jgi:hypothetical protein
MNTQANQTLANQSNTAAARRIILASAFRLERHAVSRHQRAVKTLRRMRDEDDNVDNRKPIITESIDDCLDL